MIVGETKQGVKYLCILYQKVHSKFGYTISYKLRDIIEKLDIFLSWKRVNLYLIWNELDLTNAQNSKYPALIISEMVKPVWLTCLDQLGGRC